MTTKTTVQRSIGELAGHEHAAQREAARDAQREAPDASTGDDAGARDTLDGDLFGVVAMRVRGVLRLL